MMNLMLGIRRGLVFGLITGVACAFGAATAFGADKETPVLEDLKSLDELKTQFNADKGKRRLLLLLSPA